MSFRRTTAGLSNMYLFLGVEAVVFVEGGSSFSVDEVVNGSFTEHSVDVLFWRSIFSVFLKDRALDYRAVGSKTTLISIAKDVEAGTVDRVYVCMDRDFQQHQGTYVRSPHVLYTHGYSWENDVWRLEIIMAVIGSMCPNRLNPAAEAQILHAYTQFWRDVSRFVKTEIFLHIQNHPTIFRNESPESFLKVKAGSLPVFDRSRALRLLRQTSACRPGRMSLLHSHQHDSKADCFGHLVGSFAYRIVTGILVKHCGCPSLPKHYANVQAITEFCQAFRSIPSLWSHYSSCFGQLAAEA